MIGHWQKFGEGEPPRDGEAVVYVSFYTPYQALFEGVQGKLVVAIHRYGMLHDQEGRVDPIPMGAPWTSLPAPTA